MPSTPTTRNRLNLQGTGDSVGSWGTVLNAQVFSLLDEALDGVNPIAITGNATLSSTNYATDQARKRVQKLIGSPGATFIVTIPGVEKWYLFHNTTAFSQTVKAGGIGVSVPANAMVPIYCDGTDCFAPTVGLTAPVGTVVDFAGATTPSGWLLCAGQDVSRTTYSALFVAIGTTHGAGDGSTTFGLPDLRGRATFGKDNMNGVAQGRITAAGSGITGTSLGGFGGSQSVHTHAHGVTDPTHNHSHSDPGHNHGHSDPGHTHIFSDPGHSHGYTDPGHTHTYNQPATPVGGASGAIITAYSVAQAVQSSPATTGITITSSTTGASILAALTGMTNVAAVTGVTNVAAATGIAIQNFGTGNAQNMPPAYILNKIIYAGV